MTTLKILWRSGSQNRRFELIFAADYQNLLGYAILKCRWSGMQRVTTCPLAVAEQKHKAAYAEFCAMVEGKRPAPTLYPADWSAFRLEDSTVQ